MKKKLLSLALALVLLLSCSMNVFATTAEEIEPRAAVTPCMFCGVAARIIAEASHEYAGHSSVARGGCELDRTLDRHQHHFYQDYIKVNCPNCGTYRLYYVSYEYCTVKQQYIY